MDEKKRRILSYDQWRHRIPLEDDFETPGYLIINDWDEIGLPSDLSGKSFLDIGANDGIYSFTAEKKGAKEIMAADLYNDGVESSSSGSGWNVEGINLAREYLDSKVEIKSVSIYDLNKLNRTFDYVFCSNVLGWLDNIPAALKNMADVTNDTLFIRAGFFKKYDNYPLLKYEDGDLIYRPNKAFMEKVLMENGFRQVSFRKMTHYAMKARMVLDTFRIKSSAKVYEMFDSAEAAFVTDKPHHLPSLCQVNGRHFFRKLGWIDENDIEKLPAPTRSIKNIMAPIIGVKWYQYLKSKWISRKQDIVSYTVIAKK